MSGKKTQFSAVITLAGQMESSVSKMFGQALKETGRIGKALKALQVQEKLALEGRSQEILIAREEAHLNKLLGMEKKAKAAASASPFDKRARMDAEKLTAAVEKQARAVDKEYDALAKLDHELKQAGVDSANLERETQRLGASIAQMEGKVASGGRWRNLGSAAANVGGELKRLGVQAAVVGGALGYLVKTQLFDTATHFENLQTRLKNADGKNFKKNWDWLLNFESRAPYNIDDVTEAFVKLKNIGLDPVKSGIMDTVADTAAQFGEKTMARPIETMTSAIFRGRYTMLGGYGVSAMTKGGNVTFGWDDKERKHHEKSVDKSNKALVASALQAIWNDKYGGAISKFMETWNGMISSLQTKWELFRVNIMDAGLFDFMKNKLGNFLDWTNARFADGSAKRWAQQIGDAFSSAGKKAWEIGEKFVNAWNSIDSALRPILGDCAALKVTLGTLVAIDVAPLVIALGGLAKAFWAVQVAGGPVMWLASGIAAAIGLLAYRMQGLWGQVIPALKDAFNGFVKLWKDEWGIVEGVFKVVVGSIESFFTHDFGATWWSGIEEVGAHWKSAAKEIGDAWDAIKGIGDFQTKDAFESNAQNESGRRRSQFIRGGRGTTNNYHITVHAAPHQDPAQVAADTKTRLEQQHPALTGATLHD